MKILNLIIINILFLTAVCSAKIIHVKKQTNINSLQKAIKIVNNGDSIIIHPGVYKSSRSINLFRKNNITITGIGKVEILCANKRANVLTISACNKISIRKLKLKHTNPGNKISCTGNVITLDTCNNIRISHCGINGCGAIGLYAYNCKNVLVTKCNITYNSKYALYLESTNNVKILGNRIAHNDGFLYKQRVEYLILSSNSRYDNTDYSGYYQIVKDFYKAFKKTARFKVRFIEFMTNNKKRALFFPVKAGTSQIRLRLDLGSVYLIQAKKTNIMKIKFRITRITVERAIGEVIHGKLLKVY